MSRHRSRRALPKWTLCREELECRSLLASDISFAETAQIGTGRNPTDIVASYLDNDRHLDLAVTVQSTGVVDVLFGKGDGTFLEPQTTPIAAGANRVVAGDFDLDGDFDLATTTYSEIAVLQNDGKGAFENIDFFSASQRSFDLTALATGDFDGDGDLDLAVGNLGNHGNSYRGAGISILINNRISDTREKTGFAESVWYETGRSPRQIAIADLNNDGNLDLATANSSRFCCGQTSDVSILLGNGDGTFAPETRLSVGDGPESITAGDLDGDGDLDLIVGRATRVERRTVPGGKISIAMGNGDGTFGQMINIDIAPEDRSTSNVLATDMNGDGLLDVAVTIGTVSRGPGSIAVLLGKGEGILQKPTTISVGMNPGKVAAGDLDGDGDLDFATPNFYSHSVAVVLNTAQASEIVGDANMDGMFDQLDIVEVLQAEKYLTGEPATFNEGDWNGDGVFNQLDLVAALAAGNYSP